MYLQFFLQIDNDYCLNCWYRNSKNSASICKRLVWKVGLQKFGYREHRNTPCSSCFFGGAQLYWRLFQNKMKMNRKQCFLFRLFRAQELCCVRLFCDHGCAYVYIYKWCHIVAWHVLHSWTALRDTHTLLDFSPLAIFRFWSLFHALKISEIPTVLLNYT